MILQRRVPYNRLTFYPNREVRNVRWCYLGMKWEVNNRIVFYFYGTLSLHNKLLYAGEHYANNITPFQKNDPHLLTQQIFLYVLLFCKNIKLTEKIKRIFFFQLGLCSWSL